MQTINETNEVTGGEEYMVKFKRLTMAAALVFVMVVGGCSGDSDSAEANKSLVSSVNQEPVYLGGYKQAPIEKIDKTVEANNEIYDVAVVQKGKEILVVYKVKHLKRFRMKQIEKRIKDKLQSEYKDYSFIVSSDMKIFLEAVELIVHVRDENYPKKKAQKWFSDIVELQKEMT